MGRSMLVITLLAAGCGRLAFDEQPPSGDAPDVGVPEKLACDAPGRFTVGATGLVALTVAPTTTGLAVLAVHDTRVLSGWTFDARASGLVPMTAGVALEPDADAVVGAASIGEDIVIASLDAPATRLTTRGPGLEARGPAQMIPAIAADIPIATSPVGTLALATLDASARVEARAITAQTAGAPVLVADAADAPGAVTLARGGRGFVAAYVAAMPSPNEMRLVLLDEQLSTVAGARVANATSFDPARPRVAWSPAADVYLLVWFEKNAADGDDVWWQLLDATLQPVGIPQQLATDAIDPQVTSDGTDFWVTWRDLAAPPNRLEVSRVTATGAVLSAALPASTGRPVRWAMTERAGQAVVVWAETGGTGPDLWIVGLCP